MAPNMDDIAFFDTSALDFRGGIFSSAAKITKNPTTDVPAGKDETPTQPGVEIPPAEESLTGSDAPGLRKRTTSKSKTLDIIKQKPALVESQESDSGLTRVETSPVLNSKQTLTAGTRNWFSQNGSKVSLPAKPDLNIIKGGSGDSLKFGKLSRKSSRHEDHSKGLGITNSTVSSSTSSITEPEKPEELLPESAPRVSKSLDLTTGSLETLPSGANLSPSGSTSTLISSIKARDKKALQSQVNTGVSSARDAVKKWGANWSAKRKSDRAEVPHVAPMYRPPDEERDIDAYTTSHPAPSRTSDSSLSLQERLNLAAAHAAQPPIGSISSTPSQNHSHASVSRPGSFRSTSGQLNNAMTGSSPPKWNLSTSQPTTELVLEKARAETVDKANDTSSQALSGVATDHVAAGPSLQRGASNTRRPSASQPVYTQPSAGKSMIVPRIPKRPGEVVGIGSNEAGITRRISNGQEESERPASIVNNGSSPVAAKSPLVGGEAVETLKETPKRPEGRSTPKRKPVPVLSESPEKSSRSSLEVANNGEQLNGEAKIEAGDGLQKVSSAPAATSAGAENGPNVPGPRSGPHSPKPLSTVLSDAPLIDLTTRESDAESSNSLSKPSLPPRPTSLRKSPPVRSAEDLLKTFGRPESDDAKSD